MGLFFVLTAMLGWMIGPLLQFALSLNNGSSLVGMAAAMTAGVFFTMSMLARSSKINMNAISKFLLVGFVVLLVGVVANFFLKLPALALTISAGFVIFSSVMIMFQTKAVIDGGEDSYISAALTIFISLYNIFSSLLHILISLSGND
jgi:modulator of FtsH protease